MCNFFVVFEDSTNMFSFASTIEISIRFVGSFITGHFTSLQYLVDKERSTEKICLFQSKWSNFNTEVS